MGKGKPMKISRKGLLAAIAVSAVLLLSFRAASPQQSSPQLSSEQIAQIVASPDRSEADRTNDLRRKPEQMLAFIGIRPGIVALDLSAAGGYTTELLARAIGLSGTVYGQSQPRDPSRTPTPPAAPEGNSNPTAAPSAASATPATARRPSAEALAERDNKLRSNGVPAAPIVAISRPFADPVLPEHPGVGLPVVTVGLGSAQAPDAGGLAGSGVCPGDPGEPQHVVERPVLEHEDEHVANTRRWHCGSYFSYLASNSMTAPSRFFARVFVVITFPSAEIVAS